MAPTDDRWTKADRLLDAALDLPAGERVSFLDQACKDDPELRALMGRLLASAEADSSRLASGGALRGPLWAEMEDELSGEGDRMAGTTVGRYRIVREVGRGGMAVVYLAERADGQFQQQVALKLLKRGLETEEVVRRFDQERQILAVARHPGLARLLDGGVGPGGRPYLVMEHVEGQPIDRWCDERRLPVDERLRLFLQVARAVEDAHRNLIIHRDIKPSNILVTGEGHAKLLDFGIAKLLDPQADSVLETRTALRLMTPAWASPEQVQGGPVTTASDIYQLGLLLYVLLAGRWPYRAPTGAAELAHVILTDEPTRPSSAVTGGAGHVPPGQDPRPPEEIARARSTTAPKLRRELAGDLDTIVSTALRKEPERRYPSVSKLVTDVERYLDGRPISARPDTMGYRTGKFVRRNAGAVATGLAALALVIVLMVGYTLELARERDRARLAAARATQVSQFLRGLFEVAAPSRSGGEKVTARQLLDRGVTRLDKDLASEPELQADMMNLMGDVYRELALYEEGRALLERSVAIRRRIPGDGGLGLAASLHNLARMMEEQGDHAPARRLYEEALALRERALSPDHPDLGRTFFGLGRVLEAQGDLKNAISYQERAVGNLEKALGLHHPEVGLALRDLGITLGRDFQIKAARPRLERALKILEASYGPDHPHTASARMYFGQALSDNGDREGARKQYELALPALERAYGSQHPSLVPVLTTLGDVRIAPGVSPKDPDTAIAYYERALKIQEVNFGPAHPQLARSLSGLGRCWKLKGDDEKARSYFERSLTVSEAAFGPEHLDLALPVYELAGLHERAGHHSEALRYYERELKIREKAHGPGHDSFIMTFYSMARLRRTMGEPAACVDLLRRALKIHAKGSKAPPHGTEFFDVEMGGCLTDLGRFEEAETLLKRVAKGEEPHSRRRAMTGLVSLYEKWGKPAEAARWRGLL
ncbi:MAG TPA: serine/threonine-protein kinase [Thermoanaerobaculia bacterium]|nr:serine/threonine-protein kinase [Thermoanaerobaculia bacterium]